MRFSTAGEPLRTAGALLLQPHGFEGVGVVEAIPVPDDLAVLELGQTCVGVVELDPALSASAPYMTQGDDSIAEVAKLRPLNVAYGKALVPVPDVFEEAPVASDHGGLSAEHHPEDAVPLNFGVELVKEGFVVAAVVRLDCTLECLHVLLRHRLLRQTDRFEGLRVVPEELLVEDPALAHGEDDRQLHIRLRALACATVDMPHDHSVGGVDEVADRFQCVGVPRTAELLPLAH